MAETSAAGGADVSDNPIRPTPTLRPLLPATRMRSLWSISMCKSPLQTRSR